MTRVTKGLCLYTNSDPKGLSAPALGLYTCIKTWKTMYKIRLQRYFLETFNKWAKWPGFSVDIRILSTKGCLPLPWAMYMWKKIKMCIKSEFKEICYTPRKLCLWGVYCFHIRPSVRPSVTFWFFFNTLKRQWWKFIKFCRHIDIDKMSVYNRKLRARGQFCWSYCPL